MPKVALMMDMGKLYDRDFEAVHLGTCIMKAVQTAKCPIDIEDIKKKIETKIQQRGYIWYASLLAEIKSHLGRGAWVGYLY